ncbi:MAG: hypothetical protein REI78_15290 [Pedobacter sp.]|nr:hypothetical protein [Pedobacter sp.]MDQ8054395.1 hypothetical protein [Pedobacter sp.]
MENAATESERSEKPLLDEMTYKIEADSMNGQLIFNAEKPTLAEELKNLIRKLWD